MRTYLFSCVLLGVGVMGFVSCAKKEPELAAETLFKLQDPQRTGIHFVNRLTSSPQMNILEYLYFYNGGGVAAGDIDNDGLVDLYFTGNQVSNRLYRNQGHFLFEDITQSADASGDGHWSTGVTMADVNGDGLLDIYVCQIGGDGVFKGHNRLYINQGAGAFKESAAEYGLDFKGLSTHAAFFDYDRDGDLDMYLLTHSVVSPEIFVKAEKRLKSDPGGDKLFKNLLSEGKCGFDDVTQQAGIFSSILGFGLGVAVEDFNNDDWLDIYVSNDFTENDYLYINQQDGMFRESLGEMIPSTSRFSMGNDAADLNGDGLPEIFSTDMLPDDPRIWMKSSGEDNPEVYDIKKTFGYQDQYVRNHLQVNKGGGRFAEVALFSGVYASDWSWSPLLFDMDNDGLVDIHVTNGIVKRPNDFDFVKYSQEPDARTPLDVLRKKQIEMLPTLKIPNCAWKNLGNLRFENQSKSLGLDQDSYSNGSVYADLDNDGDLDLVLNNLDQESFVYENTSERLGHAFLKVRLSQPGFNRQALGAQVKVISGDQSWAQRISTSRGFQSGPAAELVFGLGNVQQVDSILVTWPTGDRELFPGSAINQFRALSKGTGADAGSNEIKTPDATAFPEIRWIHQEKDGVNEFQREYLMPKGYSRMGPALAVADVNEDGLEDVYLGGAKDQPGSIFLQNPDGTFTENPQAILGQFAETEDTVAEFADLNGDALPDLYVGTGGSDYISDTPLYYDRIFFGDGKGNFTYSPTSLPPMSENTSAVALCDVDGDQLVDIFVATSHTPGDYGASPRSTLLINQGGGQFRDETQAWFGKGTELGMINAALFSDLDGDGCSELVLAGDWMGIRLFDMSTGKAAEKSPQGLEHSSGWITALQIADLDQNGRPDLVVGNLGLNSKLKASSEKPVWLYHHDFDRNGQADPVIFHYMGDKLVPFPRRDDLIRQIPMVKRRHASYADYARIGRPEDLFTKAQLEGTRKLPAYDFRSGVYFQDENRGFRFVPFPDEAQWGPIMAIEVDSGTGQVWLGGNFSGFRCDLGKSMNLPPLSYRRENGKWAAIPVHSNLSQNVEIRKLKSIRVMNRHFILGVRNSGAPVWLH